MSMFDVTMTQTAKGSPDGVTVRAYSQGITYTIPESLARAFVTTGRATYATRDTSIPELPVAKPVDPVAETFHTPPAVTEIGPTETATTDGPSETKPKARKGR
jgi:hypothetical protein